MSQSFEERIKPTTLTKSYSEILVVILNIPLKTQISVVLLLVEGFEQGALRKTKGVDHGSFHKAI